MKHNICFTGLIPSVITVMCQENSNAKTRPQIKVERFYNYILRILVNNIFIC